MEPNRLNSPDSDDPQLDAWLRANTPLPPLADDGFSRRVLAALPAREPRRSPLRLAACVVGAVAGTALVLLQAGSPADLPAADSLFVRLVDLVANPAVGLAVGTTLASLGYVYWSELRRFVRL